MRYSKIGVRLIQCFTVTAFLIGAVGVLCMNNTARTAREYVKAAEENSAFVEKTADLEILHERIASLLSGAITEKNGRKDSEAELLQLYKRTDTVFRDLYALDLDAFYAEKIESLNNKYSDFVSQTIDIFAKGGSAGAQGARMAAKALQAETAALHQAARENGLNKMNTLASRGARAASAMRFLTIGAILLGLGLGVYCFHTIGEPAEKLAKAAEKIAQGSLDVELDLSKQDELGETAAALGKITYNLNRIMTNINEALSQMTTESGGLKQFSLYAAAGAAAGTNTVMELRRALTKIVENASSTQLDVIAEVNLYTTELLGLLQNTAAQSSDAAELCVKLTDKVEKLQTEAERFKIRKTSATGIRTKSEMAWMLEHIRELKRAVDEMDQERQAQRKAPTQIYLDEERHKE